MTWKHVAVIVIITWLAVSLVPALSLMSLTGMGRRGAGVTR